MSGFTKEHDSNVIPIHGFNHHQEQFDNHSTIDNLACHMAVPPTTTTATNANITTTDKAALPLPPQQQQPVPQQGMQFYDTNQEFL